MQTHYKIAKGEIGVTEVIGEGDNPRVLEYFKKVGHSWVKEDSTAWCAAFVGWCLEMAGIKSSRKLNARSYLTIGKRVTKPQEGDIVVFWRDSKTSWKGHVGFYAGETDTAIKVLGGNQSNMVQISEYPKYRLLEYRRVDSKLETVKVDNYLTIKKRERIKALIIKLTNLL